MNFGEGFLWAAILFAGVGFILNLISDGKKVKVVEQRVNLEESINRKQDRDIIDVKARVDGIEIGSKFFSEKLSQIEKDIIELKTDGDYFQDHLSRHRDSLYNLRDSVADKNPVIKFPEPVPVSLVETPKPVARKKKALGKNLKSVMKNEKRKR